MARDGLSENATSLLASLPADGSLVSNAKIREKLGLSKDEYNNAKRELRDAKLVKLGTGKGGRIGSIKQSLDLPHEAQAMLERIPPEGSNIGNNSLRISLGLSPEKYFAIRQELLKRHLIQTGKGRGGSVSRTPTSLALPETTAYKGLVNDEDKLYPPVQKWLESQGKVIESNGDYYWIKKTAYKRRKTDVGQWSQPDFTFIEVDRFEYLPQKSLEISTYEVKRYLEGLKLSSVYEAASHQRWSHYANLIIEVPDKETPLPENLQAEAARFGVSILLLYKTGIKEGYDIEQKSEPVRQNPDTKEVDGMLKDILSDDSKVSNEIRDLMK